ATIAIWRLLPAAQGDQAGSTPMLTLLRHGAPLSLGFAVAPILMSIDRLFLLAFGTPAEVGLYSAGYDLAQRSLGVLMVAINLAALPLAVAAYEKSGSRAAHEQLK